MKKQTKGQAKDAGARVSLRALARLIGVTEKAIRNGVASGRLSAAAIGRNAKGRPFVRDVALARHEWVANAGRIRAQSAGPVVARASGEKGTLAEAQRRATLERGRKLKIENDVRAGQLVVVATVAREAFEAARIIRESVLNVPARIAAELAAESDAGRIFVRLDAALREVLTTTADQLVAKAAHG